MQATMIEGVSAIDILRKDHEVILDLFRQVEAAASDLRKKAAGDRCLDEIEAHAFLEEKIFYPAVRRDLGEDRLVSQSLADHAAARRLIDELKGLPPGERYNSRFRELRENLVSHIDEEETYTLPRVERSDMDVEQLGAQMLEKRRRAATEGPARVSFRLAAAAAAGAAIALSAAVIVGAALLARRLGGRFARS